MKFVTNNKKIRNSKETSYTVSALESEVIDQFNYLSKSTFYELYQEEPFLGVATSDDPSFKFKILLTFGGPNLFLLIDKSGGFRIEGHSPSCSSVTMNGHNIELLNYFNDMTGE